MANSTGCQLLCYAVWHFVLLLLVFEKKIPICYAVNGYTERFKLKSNISAHV